MRMFSLKITAIVAVAAFVAGTAGAWRVTSWAHQAGQTKALKAAYKRHEQQLADRDAAHTEDMWRTQGIVDSTLVAAAADQALVEQLREQLAGVALVESQEVPSVEGKCTEYRRGARYRVCFNAALSGDAEAIAACGTDRVPASLPGQSLQATNLVEPGS